MSKLSREKIALLIFVALILFGLGVTGFYMTNIGHSFNYTASSIDDATGDLDDYTAIVYSGTAEKKKALNEAGLDDIAKSSTETTEQTSINKTLELGKDQTISNSQTEEVTASELASKSADAQSSEEAVPVSVASVRNSFLRKHASVIELDVENPKTYLESTVVKAGKYRFGILYIDEVSALPYYVNSRVKEYKNSGVDFVVAVVDDLSRVATTEGIDIVVSTQEEGLKPVGVSSEGVFFNDAALVGEVGTLLISPSKVISAKDISEL